MTHAATETYRASTIPLGECSFGRTACLRRRTGRCLRLSRASAVHFAHVRHNGDTGVLPCRAWPCDLYGRRFDPVELPLRGRRMRAAGQLLATQEWREPVCPAAASGIRTAGRSGAEHSSQPSADMASWSTRLCHGAAERNHYENLRRGNPHDTRYRNDYRYRNRTWAGDLLE